MGGYDDTPDMMAEQNNAVAQLLLISKPLFGMESSKKDSLHASFLVLADLNCGFQD